MGNRISNYLNKYSSVVDTAIKPWHHVLFWTVYFIFNTFRWSFIHDDFLLSLRTNIVGFPIHIFLAYFNAYYLMPKFIYKKKYVVYVLYITLSIFMMLLVKYNLTYYLVSTNVMPESSQEINSLTLGYAVQTMIGEVYVISFFTTIKLTIDSLRKRSKLHDLEKRQLKTELRFLRSQVSPHFFFNTLNNIYSLTLDKSDQAPEVILKLSELMRYLLYATKKQRQDLSSEINCIRNYIDLERIRFDDSLQIEMNISGNLNGCKIPPMLLIPIIENCFKHGASKNIGEMKIVVDVAVANGFMDFKVSNSIPSTKKELVYPVNSGGIGLSNVKKRLELGYGKNNYDLQIFEENEMFNVFLKLKVI